MSEINIESLFRGNQSWLLIILVIILLSQPSGFKPGCKDPLSSILPLILLLMLLPLGGRGGKGCKF